MDDENRYMEAVNIGKDLSKKRRMDSKA